MTTKRRQIDSLQALRAAAAALVMLFHMNAFMPSFWGFEFAQAFTRGESGVDIFFVLSGFIIHYAAVRKTGLTRLGFAKGRFTRLYPIYWTVLLVLIGAELVGLSGGNPERLEASTIIPSILLIPNETYVLEVAWSLVLEVLFYVFFALTFFRSERTFFVGMLVWSSLAVAARLFDFAADAPVVVREFLLYSGVTEFGFGALIAHLAQRGVKQGAWVCLVLGAVTFCLALTGLFQEETIGREFAYGIPSALLVYGAYHADPPTPKVLVELGNASYVLYLVHGLSLSLLIRVGQRLSLESHLGQLGAGTLVAVATLGVAYLVHRYYELPLTRLVRRYVQ